ncbi:hypothetical protein GCM10009839_31670 [Catenulispora yoronensis]|uniref:DUF3558 domain-containing protein n=1 Tax=Catenulispora yoronensis TaxID=450799 RepID=A0ABP5FMC7_9ACTN
MAAVSLVACGGSSGSVKGDTSTSKGAGSFPGSQSSTGASSPSSAAPSFDPAAGPLVDAAQLPKTCSGLVTDADMQLALGNPLSGGDFFQPFQPNAGYKQTGRVVCQYGVVLDAAGKIASNQVEVQLATYADAASARSRGAATVGNLAGSGAQYAPISVAGHPATYVTEAGKDVVLVMFDGNRTFLITVQEALVKGDDAKAFVLKIGEALYKHTTPTAPATPATPATPAASAPSTPAASAPSTPAAPASPAAPSTPASAPAS